MQRIICVIFVALFCLAGKTVYAGPCDGKAGQELKDQKLKELSAEAFNIWYMKTCKGKKAESPKEQPTPPAPAESKKDETAPATKKGGTAKPKKAEKKDKLPIKEDTKEEEDSPFTKVALSAQESERKLIDMGKQFDEINKLLDARGKKLDELAARMGKIKPDAFNDGNAPKPLQMGDVIVALIVFFGILVLLGGGTTFLLLWLLRWRPRRVTTLGGRMTNLDTRVTNLDTNLNNRISQLEEQLELGRQAVTELAALVPNPPPTS